MKTQFSKHLSTCLPLQALLQHLQFFSELAVSVKFQETAEFLKHREMSP